MAVIGTLLINPQAKILVVCKENSLRSFLQLIESLEPSNTVRELIGRVASEEEAVQHRLPLDVLPARMNPFTSRACLLEQVVCLQVSSRTGCRRSKNCFYPFFISSLQTRGRQPTLNGCVFLSDAPLLITL